MDIAVTGIMYNAWFFFAEKAEYQAKMERRKWINRILTIFGALGTIITIYSFLG